MPFKTWATGDVPTATEINDHWEKQVVIQCTSGTHPGSPVAGMVIIETDTGVMNVWDGSAWRTIASYGGYPAYTPTWGGTGLTVGNGTAVGAYSPSGRHVRFRARFTLGSTSSIGAGNITVSLPFAQAAGVLLTPVASFYDTSASKSYLAGLEFASTTTMYLKQVNTSGLNNRFDDPSSTAPFTWATGDELRVVGVYEQS